LILAVDPGTSESAYVITGKNLKPLEFGKVDNYELLKRFEVLPIAKRGLNHVEEVSEDNNEILANHTR
jgi:hypothetical protein